MKGLEYKKKWRGINFKMNNMVDEEEDEEESDLEKYKHIKEGLTW
jgi:hypothetical protein